MLNIIRIIIHIDLQGNGFIAHQYTVQNIPFREKLHFFDFFCKRRIELFGIYVNLHVNEFIMIDLHLFLSVYQETAKNFRR